MRNLRFWQKTYLLTLLLFLAALYGGIIFIGLQTQRQMLDREMEKAKSEQHFVVQSLSRDLSAIGSNIHLRIPAIARSYGQYYEQEGVFIEIARSGEVLFSNVPDFTGERFELLAEADMQAWTIRADGGTSYSVVASSLSDGFEDYTLVCARSLEPVMGTWAQMRSTLTVSSVLVSVVLAFGLFFILRSLSKPLERLAGVADDFAEGDFSVRAAIRGNDEIGNLANSFNAMADAAQRNIAEIRSVAEQNARMAANLSHEVRTPLTAIQGYAEYMLLAELSEDERTSSLQYIVEESTRLQKISQRMLQLSTLEHEALVLAPVALSGVIQRVTLSLQPKAEKAHLTLDVCEMPDVEIHGDGILLESLFTNLLDNAIKACAAGGKVTLLAQRDGQHIVLSIKDTGCGLRQEELQKIGEPFYRPDISRSRKEGGAGLGVALCYQIAGLHGADISYTSVPRSGTEVKVKFTTL